MSTPSTPPAGHIRCPRCEGTGRYQRLPLSAVYPCAVCSGKGYLVDEDFADPAGVREVLGPPPAVVPGPEGDLPERLVGLSLAIGVAGQKVQSDLVREAALSILELEARLAAAESALAAITPERDAHFARVNALVAHHAECHGGTSELVAALAAERAAAGRLREACKAAKKALETEGCVGQHEFCQSCATVFAIDAALAAPEPNR